MPTPHTDEPLSGSTRTASPPDSGRRITAPRVFWPALGALVVFLALAFAAPEQMGEVLSTLNGTIVGDLGWYYVLLVAVFVIFSVWVALSPMGNIVLGRDDEKAEFSLKSWFAMLFAAGMGIGLVFWGVAEPLNHFASPPPGTPDNAAARAREAMDTTFLHWGLHAWAIYVVVGLAVAYTVHRRGMPISLRWTLQPILGDRVKGWVGDVIDVTAIVGTLFGVATSLGLGVSQIGAGLSFLGVIDEASEWVLVALIAVITAIAVVSVVTGVDKGIRYLSNVNMGLAGVLAIAVLLLGPTVFLLSDFVQQVGSYVQNFIRLSFRTLPFEGEAGVGWLSGWTTYYWGWWMSWAPFVGIFIARISRGRTVREFVTGVLLVPTLVTFLWFSILGGSALYRELFGQGGMINEDGGVNTSEALFLLLDGLPLAGLLSVIAIFLIVVFFVTSSDSGSFVVDMLASGGVTDPPVWSRIMWGVLEGSIAAALLLAGGGGLGALQTMAILVAAPFSIIMVLMMISTARSLLWEHGRHMRRQRELERAELVSHLEERIGS
ncbi:BCCT family transporter [Nostocoides sp. F2B08]|uniref:BCCT family transporter n=1 Tax=Nostocoides sp. F2B08 TaxID=2653936 RepID=UPI001D059344|nr:BCCT family transporter [Tetrasphaera sp. F2B08]